MDVEQRRRQARALLDCARRDADYPFTHVPEDATVARMYTAVEEAQKVLTQALNGLDELYEDGED